MSSPSGPLLIVEDIPSIRQFLEVTLTFNGYTVLTATNGQEALEVSQRERPVLVVTDILMPKLDGFALVYKLRDNPETSQIPVIFLSATYITHEDREFALRLGAARFLEKPIDAEEFLLTVAEVLMTDSASHSPRLNRKDFYAGYRERLENKLRHKNAQIARTERLLESLPAEQKPAFEAMLSESRQNRDDIRIELDQIHQILGKMKT